MKKYLAFAILSAGAALLIIFATSGKMLNFQNSNFLAAIGFQNTASTSVDASTADSTTTLAYTLQQFQNQIQSLNRQTTDLRSQIEIANLRSIFTRTLKRGDTGDDVSKLQELLARFPELYSADTDVSSTVTGFYGSLTSEAVAQFQSEGGLLETGNFDSSTKEKFYESLSVLAQDNASTEFTPVDISSILNNSENSTNQTLANIEASTTDLQNQVSQLSSDLNNVNTEIASLQNQLITQQSTPSAEAMPQPTPTPTPILSPSSTTSLPASAPKLVVSNVQVTSIAQHSATVTWTTNSPSTSEVDYSTDSNMSVSRTTVVNSSAAVANHTVALQNLNGETKYYYKVISKYSTNTTASSTIQNFSTLH